MAESTLSLSRTWYMAQTGNWLGWGYGAASQTSQAVDDTLWTAYQLNEINLGVSSAIRNFYTAYDWSFLHPNKRLELKPGDKSITLPDDFAGVATKAVRLTSASTASWFPVEVKQGWEVRMRYSQQPTMTGPPIICAIEWIDGTTNVSGQRAKLIFFPQADQDYLMSMEYVVIGSALTGDNPYVYGGALHSETILQGCLAVAEQRKNNAIGPQTQLYEKRLMDSKRIDGRTRPQHYGQVRDNSDAVYGRWNPHDWNIPLGTYNGLSLD